jgi:hypothetical protein
MQEQGLGVTLVIRLGGVPVGLRNVSRALDCSEFWRLGGAGQRGDPALTPGLGLALFKRSHGRRSEASRQNFVDRAAWSCIICISRTES